MRVYFPNLRPRKDGGTYYTKIKLGFTDDSHDLNVNLSSWMKGEGHGLYECPLQVKKKQLK